jgi:hypothetical protein
MVGGGPTGESGRTAVGMRFWPRSSWVGEDLGRTEIGGAEGVSSTNIGIGARISLIRNTDVFVGVNVILFTFMCSAVYYDRFMKYRGPGNLHEFFIYACGIILAVLAAWVFLRRVRWPSWLLVLAQIGILAHFAGAFFPIEGGRLYDAHILGMRYDKYVHGFNALTGAALLSHVFERRRARVPLRGFIILSATLGVGAVIEMLEYMVMITVPNSGVGNYDNNMQDLVSNFIGAAVFVFGSMAWAKMQAKTKSRLATSTS